MRGLITIANPDEWGGDFSSPWLTLRGEGLEALLLTGIGT